MAANSRLRELYESIVRIRAVETAQNHLWNVGLIPGEIHTGIGEEGIIAGVLEHLAVDDAIACDHRPTGVFTASGVDPTSLLLELLGHPDGLCGGHGGHMHFLSESDRLISDGIVGSAGPAACGFALSAKRLRPGTIAVAFFGEGAMNQGMLMESLNLAKVWSLPVLFVCKDNGWSITTHSRDLFAGDPATRAKAFGLRTGRVDGSDPTKVSAAAKRLIDRVRSKHQPALLHARCRRPDGHFLGDPLIRVFDDPVGQTREIGSPLPGSVRRGSGSMTEQISALSALGIRLGSLGMQRIRMNRWDPLLRLRCTVGTEAAMEIERRVSAEVRANVSEALRIAEVSA